LSNRTCRRLTLPPKPLWLPEGQENIATEDYAPSSNLMDPSSDQQAVTDVDQGGPYLSRW